jgi:hypothetical protein
MEEHFITLDDPGLGGKRMYHEQHFFCAECGDPFLAPKQEQRQTRMLADGRLEGESAPAQLCLRVLMLRCDT